MCIVETICVNLPAGGVLWPNRFQPQHAAVPSTRSPQVW